MRKLIFFLLLFSQQVYAQGWHLQSVTNQTCASFRGLSVVDDSVAWVSGSKGWVGKSINGGLDWNFRQVKGFEQCDFRSLYAFDAQKAIIANAGSPAYILYTSNGGENWKLVYKNDDTAAFIDGVDFWNKNEGIIYGDPVGGRMLLLRTSDGGLSWHELKKSERPLLEDNEASFAASGTCIRCMKNGKIVIATGGKVSRLWVSNNKGANWQSLPSPILQGQSTTGIFSVDFYDDKKAVIVGGDYKQENLAKDNVFYTNDGGQSWQTPKLCTGGYRECVQYIDNKTVMATGPTGTDISNNGGTIWMPLFKDRSYHVIRKSRKGNLLIMVGAEGKISFIRR